MQRSGLNRIPRPMRHDHRFDVVADDVRGDADDADRAQRQHGKGEAVFAAVDGE